MLLSYSVAAPLKLMSTLGTFKPGTQQPPSAHAPLQTVDETPLERAARASATKASALSAADEDRDSPPPDSAADFRIGVWAVLPPPPQLSLARMAMLDAHLATRAEVSLARDRAVSTMSAV